MRPFKVSPSIPSLGGRTIRLKPGTQVTIVGPKGQETPWMLFDPGADDIVLHFNMAARLGIDLSSAHTRHSQGVGGQSVSVRFAPVILELSDSMETVRWRANVSFARTGLRIPLFGIAGGLEYFRTTFDFLTQTVEMEPHSILPQTQDLVP